MANFHFDVDTEYAKKHNELLKDTKRLQISAALFGLIQLGIGAAFFAWLGAGMGTIILVVFGVMALISFGMIAVIPKQVGKANELYDAYPLCPAVIAKVNPRDVVLLALVNINQDASLPPRWGLAARTVSNLDGHARAVGEKVPAVAVNGRRSSRNTTTWDEITPMPIAWGTPDPDVIKRAKQAIPQRDWDLLQRHSGDLEAVRATKYDLMDLR